MNIKEDKNEQWVCHLCMSFVTYSICNDSVICCSIDVSQTALHVVLTQSPESITMKSIPKKKSVQHSFNDGHRCSSLMNGLVSLWRWPCMKSNSNAKWRKLTRQIKMAVFIM